MDMVLISEYVLHTEEAQRVASCRASVVVVHHASTVIVRCANEGGGVLDLKYVIDAGRSVWTGGGWWSNVPAVAVVASCCASIVVAHQASAVVGVCRGACREE
jgi:hypothetical protein